MPYAGTYLSCLLLCSLQQFLKSCENINWVALLAPCCWPFSVLGGNEKRLIWSKLVALSGTACWPYSTLLYEQYHLDNFLCGVQRYDQISGFGTVNESQNQENVLFNADSMLTAPSKSFSGLQSLFVKMHGLICFNWCGRQLSWLEHLPEASIDALSLHYDIYKYFVKLATFKISYRKQRKWRKLMLMNTFCVQGTSRSKSGENQC